MKMEVQLNGFNEISLAKLCKTFCVRVLERRPSESCKHLWIPDDDSPPVCERRFANVVILATVPKMYKWIETQLSFVRPKDSKHTNWTYNNI